MASWETPWKSILSCVMVLWMLSLTVFGDTLGTSSNSNPELQSARSCPDPEVIAPCNCTLNAVFGLDMDCSKVTSEDELKRVFSNDFAFTDFWRLSITKNIYIRSLREGDLGSVSFTEIYIRSVIYLSEIEEEALNGSFQTLVILDINHCPLKAVPNISPFTRLEYLSLWGNQITRFLNGSSATLLEINLSNNRIDDVPEDAVIGMTALKRLNLYENELTEIHPHTFTRNENLNNLGLGRNMLTTLPDHAITLHGRRTELDLNENQITTLTYEAVSSVTGWLYFYQNKLTEVSEKVFRPLLEDSVNIAIAGNPFKCGCDMAWLVLNQTLLNRERDLSDTTCPDGERFADLDPEVYKIMCPNATVAPL